MMAVYKKAFHMSPAARQQSTVGEIVNLYAQMMQFTSMAYSDIVFIVRMSLDAQRLMDMVPYLHMIWSAFLQIGVSLVLLWDVVGPATLGGLAGWYHQIFYL